MQQVQETLDLPGLTKECRKYMEELNLPNILNEEIRPKAWKKLVNDSIFTANQLEVKSDILPYEKIKNSVMIQESFGVKDYIKTLPLYEARTMFKHRSQMTQYVKLNYQNDNKYSRTLWKCDDCFKMDSESHLLWCESYSKLRENRNLKNDRDLCHYLHDILVHRTKQELSKLNQ